MGFAVGWDSSNIDSDCGRIGVEGRQWYLELENAFVDNDKRMTMTPEESLDCAKRYLDEATENLTFDEFEWAFEESWRGVDAQCIVGPASGRR